MWFQLAGSKALDIGLMSMFDLDIFRVFSRYCVTMHKFTFRFPSRFQRYFNGPKKLMFVTNVPKKAFKFRPIWATCGLFSAYFGFLFLTDTEDTPEYYPRYFSATILRYFPLNGLSKAWGRIAQCYIPEPLRPIVYHSYAKFFQCDLSEVENPNLTSYSCLSEFFIRKISAEKRPIHQTATLVSPVDGKILHCGVIDPRRPVLEQIKGVHYSLDEFLGPIVQLNNSNPQKTDSTLYQCVIYLAPGDYHRFHSPVDWMPTVRRHFPGRLLSVRPNLAGRLPGLYAINERVVYLGEWNHGLMSFTAVGAFGVGNIRVNIDPTLSTNKKQDNPLRYRFTNLVSRTINQEYNPPYLEAIFTNNNNDNNDNNNSNSVKLNKGDELGHFCLGSTVVLIFEAPKNQLKWCVTPGQRIKLGEPIIMDC
ncbi:unnamed protein product [Trichobilharzia szidati]|nr:unnamed protein product [Trichobilharzia szidati]CAH8842905.1 unnamed protein product [Trichobilharzia szidati]